MKQVINDALRRALAQPVRRQQPYQRTPHESGVRPGFDLAGFNQLVDELDAETTIAKARRDS
jgi:hypothetical protein